MTEEESDYTIGLERKLAESEAKRDALAAQVEKMRGRDIQAEILKLAAQKHCRLCASGGKPELSSGFRLVHKGHGMCASEWLWDMIAALRGEEAEK